MKDQPNVMMSGTMAERVRRLTAAQLEVEAKDDGGLELFVLAETIRLWSDVLDIGGRYPSAPNLSRTESAKLEAEAFAAHLPDQPNIDEFITRMSSVDLDKEADVLSVAHSSLLFLDQSLRGINRVPSADQPFDIPPLLDDRGATLDSRAYVSSWRARMHVLQESSRVLRLLDGFQERAASAVEIVARADQEQALAAKQLKELLEEVAAARSARAQTTLASQFQDLGDRERNISWALRGFTLAVLVGTVVVAALIPSQASDIEELVGHLAIVLALGGTSAYVARLAGTHRSTADWARGVQVQLETFQDFLGAVDDPAVKNRIYEEFGRRVLGPPPAGVSGSGEEGGLPTAQIVELANAIAASRKTQ